MTITSLYPVLTSNDVPAAGAFYRDVLGLETTFESDWYISMRSGAFELAVLALDHETVPEGYGRAPRGVLVTVEVDDVDAVHTRTVDELGHRPVRALVDEPFGQRHFIVAAPDGVLLDVVQPIAPSPEFAAAYVEG